MRVFNLPDLGEGLQEAEVVEWHVRPGESIEADRTMVSVETDKAIVEVPAPYSGRIEKLFADPGDKVHVGAPLVGFEGETADTGTVVGDLQAKARAGKAAAAPAPRTSAEVKATPAVRALARSLNVDLATVTPSGPNGTATTEDVKRAARGDGVSREAPSTPQRGMRSSMARNMALAHQEVAAVTVMDDADIERWFEGTTLRAPLMSRLARAVVAACKAEPGLNAWYDGRADARTLREEVDLGIAVDMPDGLLVPVLRDAHQLSLDQMTVELDGLIGKARERMVPPDRLKGATITLSNYGAIGGRYASPIVVPPMVAIVGAGRVQRQPVVTDAGGIAAHRVLPISLTFDHRAVTGGEAARFLNALKADLEK